jgi:hypothetical protein
VSAGSLLYVDDDTVASVVGAPHGALVLAKDDCENCAAYEAEIRRLQEQGLLGDLVVGKLLLTQPGCGQFKRNNPWLRDFDFLPTRSSTPAGRRSTSSSLEGHVPARARRRCRVRLRTRITMTGGVF